MYMPHYRDLVLKHLRSAGETARQLELELLYLNEHIELLTPDEFDEIYPQLVQLWEERKTVYNLFDTLFGQYYK